MKFILILLLLVLTGCSVPENNMEKEIVTQTEDPVIIVAYGDSLTEGLGLSREDAYPAQLEQKLLDRGYNVKVYNSGYSGETTTGALERINWVLQLNPEIVIFTTGANDAFRGIDPKIIENNMELVIERMISENVTVILGGMEIVDNLGERYIEQFESIYPSLAQEYNLSYIPSFLGDVAGNSSLNQDDLIHPTKEGYSIIVNENVLPVVEEVLINY